MVLPEGLSLPEVVLLMVASCIVRIFGHPKERKR
jgi:hypothetical protein